VVLGDGLAWTGDLESGRIWLRLHFRMEDLCPREMNNHTGLGGSVWGPCDLTFRSGRDLLKLPKFSISRTVSWLAWGFQPDLPCSRIWHEQDVRGGTSWYLIDIWSLRCVSFSDFAPVCGNCIMWLLCLSWIVKEAKPQLWLLKTRSYTRPIAFLITAGDVRSSASAKCFFFVMGSQRRRATLSRRISARVPRV